MMKIPVIVISGPTASGKSALAMQICEKYGGEIVSADSMQIYRTLDIGTAKPTAKEQEKVRHHMIDILDIDESFSAAEFSRRAEKIVADIYGRGKLPVLAGGTGLYIDSLIYGMRFSHASGDEALRQELYELAEKNGLKAVHEILEREDKKAAEKIHPNNLKRVIRAIEIIRNTGKSLEESVEKPESESKRYDVLYTVVSRDRACLYDRINRRVDEMLDSGLYGEACRLFENISDKSSTCMQAIGYKELLPVYEGKMSLNDAAEEIKKDTRRYAKRQITWFSRHKDAFLTDGKIENTENNPRFRELIAALGKEK